MGFLTRWLQPDPYIEEIEDPQVVDKEYHYWRIRIFYSMFLGYAFYYFTRKSFIFAMPVMINELGFDKGQLGMLASIMSISYGLSKFISGVVADRSNPRYFMAIGIIVTGFCNILFGMSSSFTLFALFWGLNGWFQGCGWPPCARYLTHWYSHNERGRWWAVWNTSHNIGGAIIPLLAGACAQAWGWRWAMYVPGGMCILVGFFLINRLRDTPQSLGLPAIEKHRNDYVGVHGNLSDEKELSVKDILFTYVLNNPLVWVLGLANFFVYIVRIAVNDWSALFLVETKGYSLLGAGACVSWFEIGGFLGSLLAGWASDKLFKGQRGPVNLIFSVGIVISVIFFRLIPPGHATLDAMALLGIGVWIYGPQMLIGVAAAEIAHKKAAATSSGFTGLFGYIGAATAGYPLGIITETYGWSGFFTTLTLCSVIVLVLLIPLVSVGVYQGPKTSSKPSPSPAGA